MFDLACNAACTNCTGPGDNDCINCTSTYYKADDGKCKGNFALTIFVYKIFDLACDKSCATCSKGGGKGCTSCAKGRTLSGSSCVSK